MTRSLVPLTIVALLLAVSSEATAQVDEENNAVDSATTESPESEQDDKFASLKELMPKDISNKPSRMSVSRGADGVSFFIDFDIVTFDVTKLEKVVRVKVTREFQADDPALTEHFPTLAAQLAELHKPMIDGEVTLKIEVAKSVEIDDFAELENAFPDFAPLLSRYSRLIDGAGLAAPAAAIRPLAPPPPPPPIRLRRPDRDDDR